MDGRSKWIDAGRRLVLARRQKEDGRRAVIRVQGGSAITQIIKRLEAEAAVSVELAARMLRLNHDFITQLSTVKSRFPMRRASFVITSDYCAKYSSTTARIEFDYIVYQSWILPAR